MEPVSGRSAETRWGRKNFHLRMDGQRERLRVGLSGGSGGPGRVKKHSLHTCVWSRQGQGPLPGPPRAQLGAVPTLGATRGPRAGRADDVGGPRRLRAGEGRPDGRRGRARGFPA